MLDIPSVAVRVQQTFSQTSWDHTSRWRQVWWRGFRCVQSPYLLCTRSLSGLIFALNWWDIMDEHIILGGALMLDDIERLRQQRVCAVVNLCAERPDNSQRLAAAHMDYLWLPVLDTHPPSMAQIFTGITWIAHHLQQGGTVYIHCAAGIGRSTTLLACWYMYTKALAWPHVWPGIKKRRPQAALTRRQVQRLEEFATLLRRRQHALERLNRAANVTGADAATVALAYSAQNAAPATERPGDVWTSAR